MTAAHNMNLHSQLFLLVIDVPHEYMAVTGI